MAKLSNPPGKLSERNSLSPVGTNPCLWKRLAPVRALVYINKIMTMVIVIIHVVVCLALISIVLLQHGKGAGIGAAFGGSSQTVFGSTGAAPFLAKLTAAVAILFMLTSLGLTFLGRQKEASVMEKLKRKPAAQEKVPVPAPPAKPAEKPAPPAAPTAPVK
jgi:preprotein translocase subunit SecG